MVLPSMLFYIYIYTYHSHSLTHCTLYSWLLSFVFYGLNLLGQVSLKFSRIKALSLLLPMLAPRMAEVQAQHSTAHHIQSMYICRSPTCRSCLYSELHWHLILFISSQILFSAMAVLCITTAPHTQPLLRSSILGIRIWLY